MYRGKIHVSLGFFIIFLWCVFPFRAPGQHLLSLSYTAPTGVTYHETRFLRSMAFAIAQSERRSVTVFTPSISWKIEMLRPLGIRFAPDGTLWVGDSALQAVLQFRWINNSPDISCIRFPDHFRRPVNFEFYGNQTLVVDSSLGEVIVLTDGQAPYVLISGLVRPAGIALVPQNKPIIRNRARIGLKMPVRQSFQGWVKLFITHDNLPGWFKTNEPVIRKYETNLLTTQLIAEYGKGILYLPEGLIAHNAEEVTVLDGHLAKVLTFDLRINRVIDKKGTYGKEGWRNPTSIAKAGGCYVIADSGNNAIRIVPGYGSELECQKTVTRLSYLVQSFSKKEKVIPLQTILQTCRFQQ